MKKYRILLAALMALPMLWACTDVDLCNEGEHPHRASVFYEYQNSKTLPDSMIVLANRILNLWKGTMKVKTSTGKGYYVANAPTQWNDATNAYEPVTGSVNTFSLPVGDYKFITFNMADEELDYTEVNQYITDPEMPLADIDIKYRTYEKNDLRLRKTLTGWTNFNSYADYIQPHASAFYYDTINVYGIETNKNYLVNFAPRELTQEVQINFTIYKDIPAAGESNSAKKHFFTIDSVHAELSGIPRSINLSTGSVDITQTNKMMFRFDKLNDKDKNTSVACHATIHVPGIVQSHNAKMSRGPGLMMLIICCSADTSTTAATAGMPRVEKKIPIMINLYNTLEKNPSIKLSVDQKLAYMSKRKLKLTIDTKKQLKIDGANVVTNSDEGSGIDEWHELSDQFIPVDI